MNNNKAKVIMFPKEKSKKVKSLQKQEAKRMYLSLSIFSVIAMSILIGEQINMSRRPQYIVAGSASRMDKLNRAIASAQPFDVVEDIQTGHNLVQNIDEHARGPASVGHVPSATDELRFGQLAGKYRITGEQSKISEIEYVESSDVSDRPIMIKNSEEFLVKNKNFLAVQFDHMEQDSSSSSAQAQVYKLFDKAGHPIGKAAFAFDNSGRFLSLKVQQ
jgi:hypothetical protein